jgi:diguanylate cyclase (GGDEF)-like protein
MTSSTTEPLPVRTSPHRPSAWAALLVATPFLAAIYLVLPAGGEAQVVAYPIYGFAMVLAIIVAARRSAAASRPSWWLIALGLAFLNVGDIVYSVLELNTPEVPYPSLADIGYLAGYATLVIGVLRLFSGRTTGSEHTPLIDAAIITSGVSAAFWVRIVLPGISGETDWLAIGLTLAYPFADLLLLLVGLNALLAGAARPRFLQFLLAGLGLYFIADVVYAVAVLDGSYASGDPVDAGWILGVLLLGVAALHPSSREAVVPMAKVETRLSRSRLALLAFAAILAPALLIMEGQSVDPYVLAGLVLTWIGLFGLVLIRLAANVDELGSSLIQRHRLQDDLAYQANHDPLTRLANRSLFELRLSAAIAPDPIGTGLIFLDLDDFKTVNDTLGHATGDALLQTIAVRIERELRSSDLAARLGGDEFAILVEQCPDEAALRGLAERILRAISGPVALAGRHLVVHGSAGIAFGRPGSTGLDLMRDADVAMYRAKSNGKDQVERHEPAMHDAIIRGYELRTELAAAVVSNEFILDYQPILNLRTGDIVAGEALVRWRHPARGILGPAEFIGIAESSGLIHELGHWILREACFAAAGWPTLPDGKGRSLGVNLSPAQLLEPTFHGRVKDVLRESGLDPKRLTFEVTESALIDLEAAAEALTAISNLGVKLALDDFGTGYSALSYLADLPFDIVKIDQSFVSGMGESEKVESLLSGILALCRSLGLLAVAEGVETEPQLARLRRLGCPEGQGFLFARPMPLAAFESLLATASGLTHRSRSELYGQVSLAPEA